MPTDPADGDPGSVPTPPHELAALEVLIDQYLEEQLAENPVVAAVDRGDPGQRRWYVRMSGEEKSTFTIWLSLGQRTLHHETYVMPAPEENHAAVYEQLLRRNRHLYGAAFVIGDEQAVYLVGRLANESVTRDELDRIVGSVYAYVERAFRPALRLGFASHFEK
jgi:hypothetical protein